MFQIALSNLHRLETTRSLHQSSVHRLESQNRGLEVTVATLGTFIQQLVDSRTDIEIPGDVRRIVAQLGVAEKRRPNNNMFGRTLPARIAEDMSDGKFDSLKKSNSTGRTDGQKLIKSQSVMEPPYPLKSALSQPNLGSKLERVSSFFAQSHNQIKQQRAQMAAIRGEGSGEIATDQTGSPSRSQNNLLINLENNENNDVQDNNKQDSPNEDDSPNDNNNVQKSIMDQPIPLEKSDSLPLTNPKSKLKSSKSAYELGSVKKVVTTKLEDVESDSLSNSIGVVHPLDICSDVNFKYGGTTKLKSIKPTTRVNSTTGQNDNTSPQHNINKEVQNSQIVNSR